MTRYEILNPAGQVAYNIPAANLAEAEKRAVALNRAGLAITVRAAKGVGNG